MAGDPLVVFADPQRAIIDYLKARLAGRPETYLEDVSVSGDFPSGETGSPTVPHVQVRYDGTPSVDYPIRERTTIGVVCWFDPNQPTAAKACAALVLGLMAIHPGDSSVWHVRVLTGRIPGVDPDSELYFVTSTFRVSTRPSAVS